MNEAFDNYLKVAEILSTDLVEMVESENDNEAWRRNYIRVVASLIEGDVYCFRQMGAVGLECSSPPITAKEKRALESGVAFSATDQVRLVVRAMYKMFSLGDIPDFGGEDWTKATEMFEKRHRLMHPKSPGDLRITREDWPRLYAGATWLVDQHFRVIELIYKKYVKSASNALQPTQ